MTDDHVDDTDLPRPTPAASEIAWFAQMAPQLDLRFALVRALADLPPDHGPPAKLSEPAESTAPPYASDANTGR
jgi:hypothetical protein